MEPSCTTGRLPERARAAACRARAIDPAFAQRDNTAHQTAYRRRVAAAFSTAYGVDIADLVRIDDPIRADWHAVRIELAAPGWSFQFLALPGTSNTFLILGPCPHCGQGVPAADTSDLAAFGHYLDHPHDLPRPPEFAYDPGHAPTCRHGMAAEATDTLATTRPRTLVALGRDERPPG
ncbi:MAG: hypothetical protein ACRDQW_06240 [Haloechinothrix sp.]